MLTCRYEAKREAPRGVGHCNVALVEDHCEIGRRIFIRLACAIAVLVEKHLPLNAARSIRSGAMATAVERCAGGKVITQRGQHAHVARARGCVRHRRRDRTGTHHLDTKRTGPARIERPIEIERCIACAALGTRLGVDGTDRHRAIPEHAALPRARHAERQIAPLRRAGLHRFIERISGIGRHAQAVKHQPLLIPTQCLRRIALTAAERIRQPIDTNTRLAERSADRGKGIERDLIRVERIEGLCWRPVGAHRHAATGREVARKPL